MNVTIGDKKTFDDWGLKLQSITISMPETKINQVNVPGADGMIDLTSALGNVRYGNRELQMIFDVSGNPERWHNLTSMIANELHGQRLKVILESDPSYYYIGRLSVSTEKSDYIMNRITITGDMDPYKYELLSSLDDWLWNDLDLETGIIRDYKELVVDGSMSLTIPGTRKETIPTFICSAALQVEWMGTRYDLPAGDSKIYAISLVDVDNILTFYGTGTVSIEYRGGIL